MTIQPIRVFFEQEFDSVVGPSIDRRPTATRHSPTGLNDGKVSAHSTGLIHASIPDS